MTKDTRSAYEAGARRWRDERKPRRVGVARSLNDGGRTVLDLGCGPGFHLGHLGPRSIGLDASASMLSMARSEFGHRVLVQGDLADLPFADSSASAAWASRSYVHIEAGDLAMALHDLHRVVEVDGRVVLSLFCGDLPSGPWEQDPYVGRHFTFWERETAEALLAGAGFAITEARQISAGDEVAVEFDLRRRRTLADTVGASMSVLIVGLNPSLHAADAGVGFVSPSNRFWRAASESGLITVPRRPRQILKVDRVGMTDLVKRATARADELDSSEYVAGIERLRQMVALFEPAIVCVVGLTGWRAATGDRAAMAGQQDLPLAGRPVYLMPNPSGLNAHTNHSDLVHHFGRVLEIANS